MSTTSPILKQELQNLGKWPDFCRARDDYKSRTGCAPAEARKAAIVSLGLEAELGKYLGVSAKGGRPKKAAPVSKAKKDMDDQDIEVKALAPPVDFAALRKRKANWGETIDWVVANVYLPIEAVDFSGCPDMKAYSYLKACAESPSFKYDFMIKMGQARMPKKVEEEDKDASGNYDGKRIVDLLEEFGDLQ